MRLRWTFGTPPRPLEVPPVEKHARMAERGHGDRRRGLQRTRVFWDSATAPPHVVRAVLLLHVPRHGGCKILRVNALGEERAAPRGEVVADGGVERILRADEHEEALGARQPRVE